MTGPCGTAFVALALGSLVAGPSSALDLTWPAGSGQTGTRTDAPGIYELPRGVFDGQTLPHLSRDGARSLQAWSVPLSGDGGTLRLFEDLAEQISAQGYNIVLRCSAEGCGGYDFRRALEVLPPPAMYVDLSAYHALTAVRPEGEAGPDTAISLLVSRKAARATAQLTRIGVAEQDATPRETPSDPAPRPRPERSPPSDDLQIPVADAETEFPDNPDEAQLADALRTQGRVVLDGILFDPGSATLDGNPPPSLQALAAFLASEPEARVIVVGHSDMSGNAEANLALSRARAAAVADVLVSGMGVAAGKVLHDGVGSLAPRDTNTTAEGRERNRRVEAILVTP